jgi:hypothetical protein
MSLRKLLTLFIVLMALGTTSSWASCTRLSSPTVMLDMVVGRVVVPGSAGGLGDPYPRLDDERSRRGKL